MHGGALRSVLDIAKYVGNQDTEALLRAAGMTDTGPSKPPRLNFPLYFVRNSPQSESFGGSGAFGTLDQMVGMLGPLPQQWENSFTCRKDERHSGLYDPSRIPTDSLRAMLDRCREDLVGTRERDLIVDVLEKGFRYEPSERITVQQLLSDASFPEIMSIHGVDL